MKCIESSSSAVHVAQARYQIGSLQRKNQRSSCFRFFAAQSVFPRMVPRTQPELHTRSNVNRDSCTNMHFNLLLTSPTQALPSSLTDMNLNS